MIIKRSVTDTLTPVQMHHGDEIQFRRCDDDIVTIEMIDTGAERNETRTELYPPRPAQSGSDAALNLYPTIRRD